MEFLRKYWAIITFILGLAFYAGTFVGTTKEKENTHEKTERYLTELILLRIECAK